MCAYVCVHTYAGVWMCVVCFHSLCCLPCCSAVKRNNLVHCGRADIVRALRGLPRTSHIMSSFTVDVLVATVREHPRAHLCERHLNWSGGVVHTLRGQMCSLASCNCPADAGALSTPLQQMSTVFTIFGAFVEGTYISCACLNPSILHLIPMVSSVSPLALLSLQFFHCSSSPSCLLPPLPPIHPVFSNHPSHCPHCTYLYPLCSSPLPKLPTPYPIASWTHPFPLPLPAPSTL